MNDALPPEELGRAGETLFAHLCDRARLRQSKSVQDVTGWDFFVEFLLEEAGGATPLDQRQPTTCIVQLKSTAGEGGHRVSAKLSAVDLIAKNAQPAFVIVFRLTQGGEPLRGYLIHLLGPQLARVLRRLRMAEARQDYAINRASITFDYRRIGVPFELTPEGLKAALAAAIGDDPVAYVFEKQRQLAELGYEDGHLEGEAVVRIQGQDHLKDLMLGIAPLVPKRLTMFDRRFGIRIPYQGPLLALIEEIRVSPPKVGDCEIVIRGDAFAPPVRFKAEIVIIPPVEADAILYIKHPDFTIRMSRDGLHFQTVGLFDDGRKTLEAWTKLTRALTYLAEGRGSLTIDRWRENAPAITAALTEPLTGPYLEQMPEIATMLERWRQLLERAGVEPAESFRFDAIWESELAAIAGDVLLNKAPVARFEIDAFEGAELDAAEGEAIEALYYNWADLAGDTICFAVAIRMEPVEGAVRYRSTAFKPLDVSADVPDLDAYAHKLAEAGGYRLLIDPDTMRIVDPRDA